MMMTIEVLKVAAVFFMVGGMFVTADLLFKGNQKGVAIMHFVIELPMSIAAAVYSSLVWLRPEYFWYGCVLLTLCYFSYYLVGAMTIAAIRQKRYKKVESEWHYK